MLSIGEADLYRVRAARAVARARAWAAGAAPAEVILDFDATPITAHSDKEQAAGHYKGGFGFHPEGRRAGDEVLAANPRPGNAGANNADDHLEVFELALAQLPSGGAGRADPGAFGLGRRESRVRRRVPRNARAVLVRLRAERRTVRDALLALPEARVAAR